MDGDVIHKQCEPIFDNIIDLWWNEMSVLVENNGIFKLIVLSEKPPYGMHNFGMQFCLL